LSLIQRESVLIRAVSVLIHGLFGLVFGGKYL